MDPEPLFAAGQGIEEVPKVDGESVTGVLPFEPETAIDIPADDQYRAPGLFGGLPEGMKIIGAIHEETDALGRFYTPAVVSRLEYGGFAHIRFDSRVGASVIVVDGLTVISGSGQGTEFDKRAVSGWSDPGRLRRYQRTGYDRRGGMPMPGQSSTAAGALGVML
jgi:hypothetical protein